jgi:FkbM family methyltransferase
MQLTGQMIGSEAIYHYLSVISPSVAKRFSTMVGMGRRTIETGNGSFWIDPFSGFGSEMLARGEHEPAMIGWIHETLKPGGIFVDVGANEGYFSVIAAKQCGETGKVYAIEPQEPCHAALRENSRLNGCNNIEIVPVVVSDHLGEAVLHLHSATNTGATSLWKQSRSGIRNLKTVCWPLQFLLDTKKIGSVDLLKIDIEGAEYEAVMGSPEVFRSGRVKALALEVHPPILAKRGLADSLIHDFLIDSGYRVEASQDLLSLYRTA